MVHSLREAHTTIEHVAAERSKHVDRAAKELPSIERARQVRSEISSLEERVAEVRKETQRITAAHEAGTCSVRFVAINSPTRMHFSAGTHRQIKSVYR